MKKIIILTNASDWLSLNSFESSFSESIRLIDKEHGPINKTLSLATVGSNNTPTLKKAASIKDAAIFFVYDNLEASQLDQFFEGCDSFDIYLLQHSGSFNAKSYLNCQFTVIEDADFNATNGYYAQLAEILRKFEQHAGLYSINNESMGILVNIILRDVFDNKKGISSAIRFMHQIYTGDLSERELNLAIENLKSNNSKIKLTAKLIKELVGSAQSASNKLMELRAEVIDVNF